MIIKGIRLTAGLLASVLVISSIPADALAATTDTSEVTAYIAAGGTSFSAGAHAAINHTVVFDIEDDEYLVDDETDVTENDAPIVAEPEDSTSEDVEAEESETTESEEDTVEESEQVSEYVNIAIANKINSYLNVRQEPDSDAAVLGKMYKNNAAIVLEQVGDWYKVQTGSMTGYIASKYVTVGDEEACKAAATITAQITTNSLRLRKKATTDSGVYTLLGQGNKVTVLDDSIDGWLKVTYKTYTGYIAAEYADVTVSYTYGESKEEIAAREAAEKAAAEKAAAEAAKKESSSSSSSNKTYKDPTGSDGQAVVDYALQFVGNKYVWGGESLTNGVDCSGFVMKVYEKFGISLPHSSYKLRSVGKKVSESELQPGDIICYSGHVAIYMGDGKIVHASNKKDGIKITDNYKYKKVITIRRVL